MKSPFPGMDPYLERTWGDVHAGFMVYASGQLNECLPKHLVSRINEREFYESPEDALQRGERITQRFIEIKEMPGEKVVTVIEMLTHPNKRHGEGQEMYLYDRKAALEAGKSVVEIDLLRDGDRIVNGSSSRAKAIIDKAAYCVCVTRGWRCHQLEVYPAELRERLPTIRIPLTESLPDATLNLQEAIDKCYRHGRYGYTNYTVDPEPPLAPEDARWADELLRQAGKR